MNDTPSLSFTLNIYVLGSLVTRFEAQIQNSYCEPASDLQTILTLKLIIFLHIHWQFSVLTIADKKQQVVQPARRCLMSFTLKIFFRPDTVCMTVFPLQNLFKLSYTVDLGMLVISQYFCAEFIPLLLRSRILFSCQILPLLIPENYIVVC